MRSLAFAILPLALVASSASAQTAAAPPVITALDVMGSPSEGGKLVFIAGTDLDPTALVTFDGLEVLSLSASTTVRRR